MASASVAARGIRGAALINGKILDDAIIGIDPTGVGKIVSLHGHGTAQHLQHAPGVSRG